MSFLRPIKQLVFRKDPERDRQTKELKMLIDEQHKAAKLLIRRDLELSQANEKLRELDQRKSEFLSIVAHQLRTPLSGIKWTLNMMLSGDLGHLTDEQREFLTKGYDSNQRMISLIEDMLGADRIGSGKFHYRFASVQLTDLIDNVLYEHVPVANKKNIKIDFKNTHKALPKVHIDSEKIQNVIENVLDNAIKYTPVDGTVEVGVGVDGGFVKVWIKDSGIGIPSDQTENIFNRFFRARNAAKLQTDGSGLGLYISKAIVEKHGGKMWFESVENQGTTFYFTLRIG